MRVLIAEDDPVSRRVLVALLERWGHEPVAVGDGEAAWALIEETGRPVLAILDWMMPGLDGATLCRRIRSHGSLKGSYLVLLTAKVFPEDLVIGLEAGADDYVTKPFDRQELRARLLVGERVLALQDELRSRVTELEAASQQIRRLEDLLPICSYCKRIRNGEDYWEQVEEYVAARTDAQFTHGICPDCFDRVAP